MGCLHLDALPSIPGIFYLFDPGMLYDGVMMVSVCGSVIFSLILEFYSAGVQLAASSS